MTTSGMAAALLRVLNELPTIVWTTDAELRLTSAAGGARLPARSNRDGVIGMHVDAYLGDSESDLAATAAHRVALDGESTTFDWHGVDFVYRGRVAPVRGPDGEITGVAGVVLDSSLVPLALLDEEWRMIEVNDVLCELFGRDRAAVTGRTSSEFVPDDAVDELHALLARQLVEEGHLDGETDFRRPDGSRGRLALSTVGDVAPGRQLTVLLDITAQHWIDIQNRQAHVMETIGRFAGGVAHDFNNVSMAVAGYANLLELRFADDVGASDDLEGGDVSQTVTDLNAAVRGIESMMRSVIPDDVEIVVHLDPSVPPVAAELTQLDQVVLNLVLNARDALPTGGRLEIETATTVEGPLRLEVSRRATFASPLPIPASEWTTR